MTNQYSLRRTPGFRAIKSAERLYAQAEYLRALETLDSVESDEERATVLRAKTLSRLDRPKEALSVIERYCVVRGDVPLLCAIAATIAAKCENFAIVDAWARRAGDPRLIPHSRSEAAWYIASGYWASGRDDLAKRALPIAFADGSPNGALRARILYGFLFGANEGYAQQARILRYAARRAMGEDVEVGLLASVTETLCALASEM